MSNLFGTETISFNRGGSNRQPVLILFGFWTLKRLKTSYTLATLIGKIHFPPRQAKPSSFKNTSNRCVGRFERKNNWIVDCRVIGSVTQPNQNDPPTSHLLPCWMCWSQTSYYIFAINIVLVQKAQPLLWKCKKRLKGRRNDGFLFFGVFLNIFFNSRLSEHHHSTTKLGWNVSEHSQQICI